MEQLWKQNLRQIEPYVPGEQSSDPDRIKLNANENPYPPAPGVEAVLRSYDPAALCLYPDANARLLKASIARHYGVAPEQVFVGNGSDEALNFAFLAYATDGRGVAFADITYGFYPVFADLYHIPVQIIPLKADFSLDPKDYYGLNKTIVIANPNAPTGLALSRAEMEGIVKANPDSVVVVDEAYVDFGAESCVAPPSSIPTCWWSRPTPSPAPWRGPAWATPSAARSSSGTWRR